MPDLPDKIEKAPYDFHIFGFFRSLERSLPDRIAGRRETSQAVTRG